MFFNLQLAKIPLHYCCEGVFYTGRLMKKQGKDLLLNDMCRYFVQVHYHIEDVIKKGGGNRPSETLATL